MSKKTGDKITVCILSNVSKLGKEKTTAAAKKHAVITPCDSFEAQGFVVQMEAETKEKAVLTNLKQCRGRSEGRRGLFSFAERSGSCCSAP